VGSSIGCTGVSPMYRTRKLLDKGCSGG